MTRHLRVSVRYANVWLASRSGATQSAALPQTERARVSPARARVSAPPTAHARFLPRAPSGALRASGTLLGATMPAEPAPPAAGDAPRGDPWATPDGDTWSELLAEVYAARPLKRVRPWRKCAP